MVGEVNTAPLIKGGGGGDMGNTTWRNRREEARRRNGTDKLTPEERIAGRKAWWEIRGRILELIGQGLKDQEVCDISGVGLHQVRMTHRWVASQRLQRERRERDTADSDYLGQLNILAATRLMEGLSKCGGITTEEYNQLKISVQHLKGTGKYRSGENGVGGRSGDTNIFFGTPEEVAKLLELARRARDLGTRESASLIEAGVERSAEDDIGAHRERPALVDAECNSDV